MWHSPCQWKEQARWQKHTLSENTKIIPAEQKLHWTFKLYDKDGSGEIDPEEMEDIFRELMEIMNIKIIWLLA